ncbi:hypothetical protein C8F01DRAFT_1148941 [Mycena amicta]|nr:hypothetical protein C8F01DRAFT_1148941 [Mycena amicta]
MFLTLRVCKFRRAWLLSACCSSVIAGLKYGASGSPWPSVATSSAASTKKCFSSRFDCKKDAKRLGRGLESMRKGSVKLLIGVVRPVIKCIKRTYLAKEPGRPRRGSPYRNSERVIVRLRETRDGPWFAMYSRADTTKSFALSSLGRRNCNASTSEQRLARIQSKMGLDVVRRKAILRSVAGGATSGSRAETSSSSSWRSTERASSTGNDAMNWIRIWKRVTAVKTVGESVHDLSFGPS